MSHPNSSIPSTPPTNPSFLEILFYAPSVLRSGIAVDPVQQTSNIELLQALKSNLSAQWPSSGTYSVNGCPPSDADRAAAGGGRKTFRIPNPDLYLGRFKATSEPQDGLLEGGCCGTLRREDLVVTAKLFYLPHPSHGPEKRISANWAPGPRYPPRWVQDAVSELAKLTGLETVDNFVVSLPGAGLLTLGSASTPIDPRGLVVRPCDTDPNDDPAMLKDSGVSEAEFIDIWKALSQHPSLRNLGLADNSVQQLKALESLTTSSKNLLRPLKINQINSHIDSHSPWARELSEYCQRRHIQIFGHSDCTNILPGKTFASLMNHYLERTSSDLGKHLASCQKANLSLPILTPRPPGEQVEPVEPVEPVEFRLQPKWVLRYTALVKSRNVIADKGYIVSAESI